MSRVLEFATRQECLNDSGCADCLSDPTSLCAEKFSFVKALYYEPTSVTERRELRERMESGDSVESIGDTPLDSQLLQRINSLHERRHQLEQVREQALTSRAH